MRREFTRVAWASAAAREVWEPRVQAVQAAWLRVEVESVKRMIRPCALVFGKPEDLGGLTAIEVVEGRFAVGRSRDANALASAYALGDDPAIGQLLGFPDCCQAFFDRLWNVDKKRDTTLSMGGHAHVRGPERANILGRWLGVRCVPHLPCRWDCEHTVDLALRLEPCWPRQELAWCHEMLNWATEYSALHGVAIVTMPVLKVVTDTDYTPREVRFQRDGACPPETPRGLKFPFNRPADRVISLNSLRSKREDPRLWTDNGFPTEAAMRENHRLVLSALPQGASSLLDLGCGNGLLMQQSGYPRTAGVEQDLGRGDRGRAAGRYIMAGTIREAVAGAWGLDEFDVACISARRLEEMTEAERADFDFWIQSAAKQVLVYSYDEPRFAQLVPSAQLGLSQAFPRAGQ